MAVNQMKNRMQALGLLDRAFKAASDEELSVTIGALDDDPGLASIAGYADDSGEGRWTVEAGIENAVATPAITAALYARFVSRQDDSPAMKAVAAMRNQFGGHATHTPPPIGGDRAAWTSGTQFPPPHEPAAEAASPAVPGPAPAPCYSSRCMHRER